MKKLLLSLLIFPLAVNAQEVFDEDQIPTITNSKLADMTAQTIKMRNNAADGDPLDTKISDLTEETSPTAGDYVLCENESGELKKCAAQLLGPTDTNTNAATICTGNQVLEGDGDCVATPVDTTLDQAGIEALGFVTGAHTVDTNTQLSEAQVDAFVANNGYSTGAHTVDTSAATECTGNQVLEGDGDCIATPIDTNTQLSESEVESAYNNRVDQVSAGEITNADDVNIHTFSPADIKSFIDTHGGIQDGNYGGITVSSSGTVWAVNSGEVEWVDVNNRPTSVSAFANDAGYITTDTTRSDEEIQDLMDSTLVAGSNVTITYDDPANTITIASTGGGGSVSNEDIEDVIGAATTASSGITFTYDDAGNSLDFDVNASTLRTTLNVEDGAAADMTGTEITLAYYDTVAEPDLSTRIAGTSTTTTRWSPFNIVDMIDRHGVSTITADKGITAADQGGGTWKISMTEATVRSQLNVEDGATADQTDSEIETAYNNQVAQVSAGEKTAGTETAVRRFSPDDVKDMIDTHGGGGGTSRQIITKSGRIDLGTDQAWVTESDAVYGVNLEVWDYSEGTGADPTYTWNPLGQYLPSGTVIKKFHLAGRVTNTDVTDVEYILVVKQPDTGSGWETSMDGDDFVFNEAYRDNFFDVTTGTDMTFSDSSAHYRRTVEPNYTLTDDAMFMIYFRPTSAPASNRFMYATYTLEIELP